MLYIILIVLMFISFLIGMYFLQFFPSFVKQIQAGMFFGFSLGLLFIIIGKLLVT